MQHVSFVVLRRGVVNESTVAIVSAFVEDELTDERVFLAKLREVITWWMLNTKTGRDAAKHTGYDFNIGDFPNFADPKGPTLLLRLAAVGINELEVTIASSDSSGEWVYDDLLFDPEKVKPT